jgi:Xaa-Pro aminopeptidase
MAHNDLKGPDLRYVNQATSGPRLPLEEYHGRWSRVQATAREMGLDGVVVWSRSGGVFDTHWDVFYLANHYSSFPMVPHYGKHWSGRAQSAFILPVDGEPTLVVDIPDHREDLVSVEDVRFTLNVPELVAEVLGERGMSEGRVGLVAGNSLLAAAYVALLEATPSVEWVPVDDLIENMHVVKSPRELELVREASAIGRSIVDAVMTAALKPGTTEAEAVAAGYQVAVTQGAAILQAAVASGPHSHSFSLNGIPAWSDRVLQSGDFFHLDCFGFVNGYQWDFGRGLVVGGGPTAEQREILETAIDAVDAGIAAIRPGVTGADAYQAIHSVLEERDMIVEGGLLRTLGFYGHSFGVGWGWPWLFPGDTRPMQAGMTLAVEAMAGRPELGSTYFEQDILITEDGAELLTTIPKAYW